MKSLHKDFFNFKRLNLGYWFLSFLFLIPPLLLYLAHYFMQNESHLSTGFVIEDMFYYMANAREHFDFGSFHLTYGNPFSPFYNTPKIYFQPMTLLLGVSWKIFQIDPGIIFVFFGFFAALVCSRIAIGLYDYYIGLKTWYQKTGLILFFYGGGVLALAGLLMPNGKGLNLFNVFRFDPFGGLWFLNFGRNLIFPNESFYHALFFGSILCLLKKKYFYCLVLCLVLSLSHPFTGIEYILILLSWSFIESLLLRNNLLPKYFFPACLGILVFHIGYYIGYLNLFEEHRQLVSQWSLPWTLKAENIIPAYCLVMAMTLWRIRRYDLAKKFFSDTNNRLFMIWFLVAFLLANHQFFIHPVQPLHFTRGYIWIPLFLMGSKTLYDIFLWLKVRMNKPFFIFSLMIIMAVFLSDNGLWMGYRLAYSLQQKHLFGIYLTNSQKQVLDWIYENDFHNKLVLSQDLHLGYYVTCYTPLRSWYSHWHNTPFAQLRKKQLAGLFGKGQLLKVWKSMDLLVIYVKSNAEWMIKNNPSWPGNISGTILYTNSDYVVVSIKPKPDFHP